MLINYFIKELSANVACGICSTLGDVSNLMMCTVCGNHYHGVCIGLALLPGMIKWVIFVIYFNCYFFLINILNSKE